MLGSDEVILEYLPNQALGYVAAKLKTKIIEIEKMEGVFMIAMC